MSTEFHALRAALEDGTYGVLVAVIRSQIDDGRDRQAIIDDLQSLRVPGQDEGVDEPETTLMGLSDRLSGWCSPSKRL